MVSASEKYQKIKKKLEIFVEFDIPRKFLEFQVSGKEKAEVTQKGMRHGYRTGNHI